MEALGDVPIPLINNNINNMDNVNQRMHAMMPAANR